MLRKVLIFLLMAPLLAAAYTAGASLPLLLLMGSLMLIAIASPSAREDIQE